MFLENVSPPNSSTKRQDYVGWSDYFMGIAYLSSLRSKDPNTQVGSCIVNEENKIVGIGYNGMPIGISDDEVPWNKVKEGGDDEYNFLTSKYAYVCHAEMNAIMNKNSSDVKDCTIYTTMLPCNECAKLIIQSRIKKVIFLNEENNKSKGIYLAARKLFLMAGIHVEKFAGQRDSIVLRFSK